MAVQKDLRILYQAKNNTTGLTDVKAQVYFNGVAKATGGTAITATPNAAGSKVTELDATNSPGYYEVLLKAADLTTWGVSQSGANVIDGEVDSTSKPASAPFRYDLTVANTDDIDKKLGAPAGATVSADIANILLAIQAVQNGVISNGVGYVIPSLIIPPSGSTTYRIPITIMNNDGALVDPTSNLVTVGLLNSAGADRGSFLTGSSGTPATVAATKDSTGQYHVNVVIPSTAVQEELLFSFAYTIGSNAMVRFGQSQTITDVNADGLALQSTLLATQTTVNSIQSEVTDATNGLPAIKTAVVGIQADITNNVEGAGFSNTTDSLHAIATYVIANLFTGGRAV